MLSLVHLLLLSRHRRLRVVSSTSKHRQPSSITSSNFNDGPCVPSHGVSVNVYYGSNMGNCKGIAEQFAAAAKTHGFDPALAPLDQAIDEPPALSHQLLQRVWHN